MTYILSRKSQQELYGVHPTLVKLVRRALELSPQDFGVHDGIRTLEEQKAHVKSGASETMDSMHLKQGDGFGHAVDLVPFVAGKLRWEWPLIYPIAAAMRRAAVDLGCEGAVRWGGVWDRRLGDLGESPEQIEDEVEAYVSRRKAAGAKRVFIDGPHYELR